MATLRQTSFAAGELSPYLHGRTDLELFAHGARRLRNFYVTQQGAAASKPGTRLRVVLPEAAAVAVKSFSTPDSSAHLLVLVNAVCRAYTYNPTYGTFSLVASLSVPYANSHLRELSWAQAGGVLTVTHPSYPPAEILAPVAGGWLYRAVRFGPPSNTPSGTQSLTPVFRDAQGNLRLGPLLKSKPNQGLFVDDAAHPAREWRWKVTSLLRHNTTGQVVESSAFEVAESFDGFARPTTPLPTDGLVVVYPDRAVTLKFPTFGPLVGSLANHSHWTPVGVNFYRGRGYGDNAVFGLVGTTRHAQDFIDVGEEPNYQLPPPRGDSPFEAQEYPATCAFFQARRVFGGSTRRPSTLWASAVDDWSNHDAPLLAYPTQPLEVTLAGRRLESVRAMVPGRRLLVLTDSSVWSVGGDGPWSYDSVADVRLEDEVGAAPGLQPLVVDNAVLYVRAKGRGVRALTLGDNGAYVAQDITAHAEHLFKGASIVSWAYARDPAAQLVAVLSDGSMLTACRTAPGLWAWSRHTTGEAYGHRIECVDVLPTAKEDLVVLAVTRGRYLLLETFSFSREQALPLASDTAVADALVPLDAVERATLDVGEVKAIDFPPDLTGDIYWAYAPGNPPQGPLVPTGAEQNRWPLFSVGPFETANTPDGKVIVYYGIPFRPELELLDAPLAPLSQKTVVKVGLEVDSSVGVEAGEDFGHLVEWRQRTVQDAYAYPSAATDLVTVSVSGAWRRAGRAALRQAKPNPLVVLGVTREVDVGGS